MSREDFDFINLSENIEKNTKDLLREQDSRIRRQPERRQPERQQPERPRTERPQPERPQPERPQPEHPQSEHSQGRRIENPRESEEWWEESREVERKQKRVSQQEERSGERRKPQERRRDSYDKKYENDRGENSGRRRERMGQSMGRRRKKKSSRLKRKLITLGVVVALLFGGLYLLSYSIVSKTNYEKLDMDYERPADVEKVRGVKNILLIGTDARSSDEDGRSDSMIILSINSKKNRMVMTSILRDSYVEIPGHGSNRINAAYSYGQEALLIQTIEQNFKIPIDAYAKVDFFSFIDIVDAVGGVEIDVTDEEMKWINAYLNETNELLGKEYGDGYLTQSGKITLTGKQALSYARIRYIGTDFQRTERQREILWKSVPI